MSSKKRVDTNSKTIPRLLSVLFLSATLISPPVQAKSTVNVSISGIDDLLLENVEARLSILTLADNDTESREIFRSRGFAHANGNSDGPQVDDDG